jgi:molecular chaperone DnaJ
MRRVVLNQGSVHDPYELLGLSPDAGDDEIRESFRRLAKECHPDKNPDDEVARQRFRDINSAYQLLSDPRRRSLYDSSSQAGAGPTAGTARQGPSVQDLFEDFFGRSTSSSRRALRHVVRLDFEQAALGAKVSVAFERLDRCRRCNGRGGEPASGYERCGVCEGRGQVRDASELFLGRSTPGQGAGRVCNKCGGAGELPKDPCERCQGRGLSPRKVRLDVRVPPGIEHGASQHVKGAGHRESPQGSPGDLELVIRINPHDTFTREGDDVVVEQAVSFTTAALGATIDIQTVLGMDRLKIPPGTAHGDELRLKGKGIPHRFRGGAGDHRVKVKLTIPERVTAYARELVLQFQQQQDASRRRRWRWLF